MMVVSMAIKGAATKLVEDTNLPDFAENIEISYRFYRTYVSSYFLKGQNINNSLSHLGTA